MNAGSKGNEVLTVAIAEGKTETGAYAMLTAAPPPAMHAAESGTD